MQKPLILDDFIGSNTLIRVAELYEQLHNPVFLLKDVGVLYRTVLHWDQQGLLEHSREESQWRRYDYIQYVWIKIIDDLRTFGVPIPIIQQVKKDILDKINLKWLFDLLKLHIEQAEHIRNDQHKQDLLDFLHSEEYEKLDDTLSVSILELLIVETLTNKVPVSLVIFSDGSLLPLIENKSIELALSDREKLTYQTHVKVSISHILKSFLSETKESFFIPQLNILEENEKKLLEIIHSGEYETITIHFKNKKMQQIDLSKEQNIKRKIVDIIQDSQYQHITIKTHKGVITKIQNTMKIMV